MREKFSHRFFFALGFEDWFGNYFEKVSRGFWRNVMKVSFALSQKFWTFHVLCHKTLWTFLQYTQKIYRHAGLYKPLPSRHLIDVVLVSLLLTLIIFHTLFYCFYCLLWTCKTFMAFSEVRPSKYCKYCKTNNDM